jgi:phosphohistidine phosphatase
MRVYLIRHASAGDAATDQLRELTEEGREEARRVGLGLRKLEARLSTIFTSPLLRARQTATLIAACLRPAPTVKNRSELTCGASPQTILSVAQEGTPPGEVAIVGHNPDLTQCTVTLLGSPPGAAFRFSPGSVCCLEIDGGLPAGLVWFRTAAELDP